MNLLSRALKEHRSPRSLLRKLVSAPFRPSDRQLELVEHRGLTVLVAADEDVGWRLVSQERYEEDELDTLLRFVEPGDLCLDVGANIGLYALHMATAATDVAVTAVEPLPFYQAVIAFNTTANRLENVDVLDGVLAADPGERRLAVPEDGGYASLRDTGRAGPTSSRPVEAETLDGLVEATRRELGVVKIDVEGAEHLVIDGADATLSDPVQRPRAILVELSGENQSAFGIEASDVAGRLRSYGFEPCSFTKDGLLPGHVSTRYTENVLFFDPAEEDRLGLNDNTST